MDLAPITASDDIAEINTITDLNNRHREASAYDDETFQIFLEMAYDEKSILAKAVGGLIDRYIPSEKRNKLIEIGAGTGAMLMGYIGKFKNAVLIEPSGKYGSILKDNFPKATVIADSYENLDTEIGKDSNCIAASHVIRYLKNPFEQLNKMVDSLEEGGKVILTMSDLKSQYTQFIKDFKDLKHDQDELSSTDVINFLEKNKIGYHIERAESHFAWRNIDELIRVMPVIIGGIRAEEITNEQKKRISQYAEQFIKPDGTYEMTVGHDIIIIDKPQFKAVPQEA